MAKIVVVGFQIRVSRQGICIWYSSQDLEYNSSFKVALRFQIRVLMTRFKTGLGFQSRDSRPGQSFKLRFQDRVKVSK